VSQIRTYSVNGMTCGHCVNAVSTELRDLDGVTAVDVDLPSGSVTVTSTQELDRDAVAAAITDAGYELA
jgi:copper ion binding protein